jgi:elongation factor Ts
VAEISAALVKDLRERTGAGMMECKKALVETGGEIEKAIELLHEKGQLRARGKLGRATSEGRIAAAVSDDRRRGALVEINCETDFVARTPDFEALAQDLASTARDAEAADLEALLREPFATGTVQDHVMAGVAKFKENIQLRRFERLEAGGSGRIYSYIHAGGKLGALVQLEADDPSAPDVDTLGRNLCMHVTAANPRGLSRQDLPAEEVARERRALTKQAEQEGKPANVVEKMVEGRLGKYFREVVLLEQPLVMDPDSTVEAALKSSGAKVIAFVRFQLGEEPSA